ncbi:MAG: crotonase/enoyl-CoA hydratase family protein [Candidatus Competibacteraceae bacterium]|jgi:enoyl-CoA hydratase/carnithine racemase|nr:crotonase/enoyl-CoA hydratase family protein [Candidatus Competibacteraceae bacterium]
MSESKISVETQGHVLLIGLNRAEKRNAFDLQMYSDLGAAYGELNRNPELRCGVLFAHGDHFTGGLDLPEWTPVFSEGRFPTLSEGSIDPLGADEDNRLRKPLVMAVQGICFTIGIEMLLTTDIRVAAAGTRFGQIEIKRGIYPVGGATVRMIQEVGWGNAMRYLLTADEISAEEAYRMGLVQEVVEHGQQLERAIAIAQTVAAQAPLGVQATLNSARISRIYGDKAAMARLLPDLMPIMKSEDTKEGVRAFVERREARFQGR